MYEKTQDHATAILTGDETDPLLSQEDSRGRNHIDALCCFFPD
jgi:hypothetical protein